MVKGVRVPDDLVRKPELKEKIDSQIISTKSERVGYQQEPVARPASVERAASPVHVVQRTWESRTRDVQEERKVRRHAADRARASPERTRPRPRSPGSRSVSPAPLRRDKKEERTRPSKCELLLLYLAAVARGGTLS